eukprot:6332802-Amphidinium_carterae.1
MVLYTHYEDDLAKEFSDDKVTVAGMTPMPLNPPSDLMEKEPPEPALKVFAWNPNGSHQIYLPNSTWAMWSEHSQFSTSFMAE